MNLSDDDAAQELLSSGLVTERIEDSVDSLPHPPAVQLNELTKDRTEPISDWIFGTYCESLYCSIAGGFVLVARRCYFVNGTLQNYSPLILSRLLLLETLDNEADLGESLLQRLVRATQIVVIIVIFEPSTKPSTT